MIADRSFIRTGKDRHQYLIILDRARALNAINTAMFDTMRVALKQANQNPDISHIVIQQAKGRAFCAGGDIRALYQDRDQPKETRLLLPETEYQCDVEIAQSAKPVISLIDGITFGAGAGIALHSGYAIATENTVLAMPEVKIGLFPDAGVDRIYASLNNGLGTYLGLCGHRLNASDVLNLGLVRYVVAAAALPELKQRLATMPAVDHDQLFATIQNLPAALKNPELPAVTLQQKSLGWIADHFQQDKIQTIIGSVQDVIKRSSALHDFADNTARSMQQGSPVSLALTLKLLRQPPLDLRQTLARNVALAHFCADYGDLYEGIRSLLIDKDNAPDWRMHDHNQIMETFNIFHNKAIFPE